jgi:hypothetical protein
MIGIDSASSDSSLDLPQHSAAPGPQQPAPMRKPDKPAAAPKSRPPRAASPAAQRPATKSPASSPQLPRSSVGSATEHAAARRAPAAEPPAQQPWLRRLRLRVPGWLVSAVVHAVALMLLGIWVIERTEPDRTRTELTAVHDETEGPEVLDAPEIQLEQEEFDVQPFEAPPVDLANLGDLNLATAELNAEVVSLDNTGDSLLSDIGTLMAGDMMTSLDAGPGKAGTVTFFGTRAAAKKVVFLVDNSNSMTGGRFETALYELARAIDQLSPNQSFYVLLFSDTAYPLFHPQPAPGLIPATTENKKKVHYWLETLEMCLGTKAIPAVERALALQPDVIYILGDGNFTDNTQDFLLSLAPGKLKIHTLGMELNARGVRAFQSISQHYGGTYKDVGVHPPLKELTRQKPRKRNSTRGPVWGLTLKN